MRKYSLLLCTLLLPYLMVSSMAQGEDINIVAQKFLRYYNSGDIINAEKCLLQVLDSKVNIPNRYGVYFYTNLGVTSTILGQYNKALNYYNLAEKSIATKADSAFYLSDIYVNKAIIFGYQRSYSIAIEYFEKGIRNYLGIRNPDNRIRLNISAAYLNIGIIYYELGDYSKALDYLKKSKDLKSKYKLAETAFVDLNIAKTYVKLSDFEEAGKSFKESSNLMIAEFGPDYSRLSEVYFEYGTFLSASGRYDESLAILKKASAICLKNYGEKHSLTSQSYKLTGDFYKNQSDFSTALEFYQKSLNSIVYDFNNPDIFTNPSADSSIFDIRLLDNLKCKAEALGLLAVTFGPSEKRIETLVKALETADLALKVIDRIRNNYLTEESRIYLAENEKETYLSATASASALFKITGDDTLGLKMYSITQKAKAAILRNEIAENDLLWSETFPDSLRQKQNILAAGIAGYNKLVLDELGKANPDSNKISLWKDVLFGMNREKENVTAAIDREFPRYRELIQKTDPVPPSAIQKKMKRDETIIDYLLSNQSSGGKRTLYTFVITRNNIEFVVTSLDSGFMINAEIIRTRNNPGARAENKQVFAQYTGALSFMYETLLKPVEKLITGNRIIVIPDEEIAWLPFDAFLREAPQTSQKDYEALNFLIKEYTFSYAYSSSLIDRSAGILKRGEEVLAFSPDYSNVYGSGKESFRLYGAENEIESIFRWFKGRKFTGAEATEANFRTAVQYPAILHLAMHSVSDSVNSNYSYLLFDIKDDTTGDGRLFNYEISLTRIASPMVVLSACNSGTGTLYHGEGMMSLARSFILAGASSVIKTSWEVNDDVSAIIIAGFYRYLSKGFPSDEALRMAKIEFIENSSPEFSNPFYWAAYEVLGVTGKLTPAKDAACIIFIMIAAMAAGTAFLYLRRRKISSARLL